MNNTPAFETRNFAHASETPVALQSLISNDDEQTPHIMFCSGFHSAMTGNKASVFHDLCEQQRWNYTRFDYRGHGASGGDAVELTLQDWLADTLAVFDDCNKPTLLIGSSMGAWLATLTALQRRDRVTGVMLLAAAPDFLQELIVPNLSTADTWDLQQGQAISIPNRYDESYPVTQALLDSGEQLSVLNKTEVDRLECPVRLIHGSQDQDVPFELSVRLMEKLGGTDTTLTLINQADHRLSDERSLSYIKQALCDLVTRCYPKSNER